MKKFKSLIGLKSKKGNPRDGNTHNDSGHDPGVAEYDDQIYGHRNTVAGSSSNANANTNTNTSTNHSFSLGRLSNHFSKGKHHRSSSVRSVIVHNGQQEAYDPRPLREIIHAQQRLNTADRTTLPQPDVASMQSTDNTQHRDTYIQLDESFKHRHQQQQQDRSQYLQLMQHRAGMERQDSVTVPRPKTVSDIAVKRMYTQATNSRQSKPIDISGHRSGQRHHERLSVHTSHENEEFTGADGYASSHGERMPSTPVISSGQGNKRYSITGRSLYGNGNPYQIFKYLSKSKSTSSSTSEAKDRDTGGKSEGQDQDDRSARGSDDQDTYYMGRFVQDPYLEYTASPTGTAQRQSAILQHFSPRNSNVILGHSFDNNPNTYTATVDTLSSPSPLNPPLNIPPASDTEGNGTRRERIRKTVSVRWDAQKRMWVSTRQPTSAATSTTTTIGSSTRPVTQTSVPTSRPPRVKGPRQMPDFAALERLHRLGKTRVWTGLSISPGDNDGVDEFTINAPEYKYEADISSHLLRQRHTMYANEYTARPNLSNHRNDRSSEAPMSETKHSSTRSMQPDNSLQRNGVPLTSRNRQSIDTSIPRHSMLGVISRHKCDHSRDTGRAFGHEIAQEEEQYIYDMDLYINRHDRDLDNHRSSPGIEFQIQQEAHRYARSMADAYRKATLSQDNSQDLDEDVFHDFDSSSSESRYSYTVEELSAVSRSPSPTFPTTPTPMMALKPPPTTAFVSSPVPVSKKTSSSAVRAAASSPATSASSKTTNTDPKRHSNATSRGSARRIIYSADVEQGLPEGHIAREGKFEIVPSNRLSNTSSRATGNRSSRLGGRGVTATSATAALETGTDYEESTVVVRTDRKGKGKAIAVPEDNNQIIHGYNRKSRYRLNDLEEQEQEQHFANIRRDEDPCGTGYKVEIDVDMVAMVARMNANITELETAIKARAESENKTEVEKTKRHSAENETLAANTGGDFSKDCAGPPLLSSLSLFTRQCDGNGNGNDGSSWPTDPDVYATNQIGISSMFLHATSSSIRNLVVPRIIGFLYHGEPRRMNKAKKLRNLAHQGQRLEGYRSSMRGCQNQIRPGKQERSPRCSTSISVGQSTKQNSDHRVLSTHSSIKRWKSESQVEGCNQGTVASHTQLQHQQQQPRYTDKPRKGVMVPLIQPKQPVKMQSLLKAVERYSWPPSAASTANSPRSSESGNCEGGTIQRPISKSSYYNLSTFSWTNPLDFPLHPQEYDRPKLHWDTSSESTTETRKYRITIATNPRVEDLMPPSAPVLIMGMTGVELIDSVKFENDHPGSLGYYGPLEFDRDEENRRLKAIAEQEKQKADKERKRAAAREKSSWVRKYRSLTSNFFLGRNVTHDNGHPHVSGAEGSPTSPLGNRSGASAGTVSDSLVNRIQSPIRNESTAIVDTPNPEPASQLSDENKKQELGDQVDG